MQRNTSDAKILEDQIERVDVPSPDGLCQHGDTTETVIVMPCLLVA
jgi:hypothetical protein